MCQALHHFLPARGQWGAAPSSSSSLLPPSPPPKVGARLSEMERQIQESRASLEKDVKALSELLARLGEETLRLRPDLPESPPSRVFL